jgi:NADH-quinone oxidoreductase subunit N
VKYFIVGSVASGVGLYGLSLLYLAFGTLQLDGLATGWANSGDAILPVIGLGMVLVGFGFKVSAAPFHFAAPDAYAGANSPVAGVLATASKAMGMVGLIRVLVLVASPVGEASATWLCLLGVLSAVTMTWGNIAALGSKNPKRMLAYSSVAHAGYLLAALTAVGAWRWGHVDMPEHYATAILAAIFFHLIVLVVIKLGAFLVLGLLEMEGGASRLSSLAGLARRDPLIATSMFIFMMALAGVPPLAGFMSKFLVIGGIIKMSIGDLVATGGIESLDSLHWVWWLGLLMFLNSALSVFYYLRIGVVMFLDAPEEGRRKPLPYGVSIRMTIWICVVATILLGVAGDRFIDMCYSAAEGLFGL